MKKWLKITLGVVGCIILCFVIDLICIFTINRPLFAIKTENNGSVNNIYKGILYDTYICNDNSTIQITYKGSKFSCYDTIKINEFINYDFSVVVTTPTEYKKIFAFEHNGINYYYGNTDFRLYLTEGNYRYDLETSLKNNLVSFEDILNKAKSFELYKDGGSKLYQYQQFNILVCNTLDGNNDVIIGETELEIENLCNSKTSEEEIMKEDIIAESGLLFSIMWAKTECIPVQLNVYDDGKYELNTSYKTCHPNENCNMKLEYSEIVRGTYNYDVMKIIQNSTIADDMTFTNETRAEYEIYTGNGEKVYMLITDSNNKYLKEFLKKIDVNLKTCADPDYN